jgi:uncharacterized Zn-binding protein involved in type VI secretion
MGMPACRITDMTAHGGIVILGYPTVLIGSLPASRIGDMHICPMLTGLVPHVGGPFILGAFTVLVGMMPQSRVTDMLVCVGPPDLAVLGEFTVLVGMAGMGGVVAASAGLQLSGVASAVATAVPTPPPAATNLTAALQQDGTLKIAAANGSLPPITLQQPGWPDLPAADTINFASVQPVTLPLGTPLSALQNATGAPSSYFMPALPADLANHVRNAATSDLDQGKQIVNTVVQQADGVKAWMGQAANTASSAASAAANRIPQIWAPVGALASQAQQDAAALQQQVLAPAEQGASLLFDEANSLFGKRSGVKDSHDRYASSDTDQAASNLPKVPPHA